MLFKLHIIILTIRRENKNRVHYISTDPHIKGLQCSLLLPMSKVHISAFMLSCPCFPLLNPFLVITFVILHVQVCLGQP